MNVALYGKPARWAMTERGRGALARDATTLAIGPSAMRWDGDAAHDRDRRDYGPLPKTLRGEVGRAPTRADQSRLRARCGGAHRWRPLAPLCDVEVRFEAPALAWRGTGYFDTERRRRAARSRLRSWTWTRFDAGECARIFYDVVQADGVKRGLALEVADGKITPTAEAVYQDVARTGWGIARAVPCELGGTPTLVRTLENAPFYARSAIRARIDGVERDGVHETLSLSRLVNPAVRFMVPFACRVIPSPACGRGGSAKRGRMREVG